MSDREFLEKATAVFKASFPGLTAESIVCFLVLLGTEGSPSVGDMGRALGMTEPDTFHHLALLTEGKGAGLIRFENMGDGRSCVSVTELGKKMSETLKQALEG